MGVRENKVETYLHKQIQKLGGDTRKWVSPSCAGVPDRICMHPKLPPFAVEVKTLDGRLSPVQSREFLRLIGSGLQVHTVFGASGVDVLIKQLKERIDAVAD